jgi:Zn-finger protein
MCEGASFVRNTACPYFPCHEGVDEEAFNCLFCYCPLFALGERCGGDFTYTDAGIKDCSRCTRMHEGSTGAAVVKELFPLLAELARPDDGSSS